MEEKKENMNFEDIMKYLAEVQKGIKNISFYMINPSTGGSSDEYYQSRDECANTIGEVIDFLRITKDSSDVKITKAEITDNKDPINWKSKHQWACQNELVLGITIGDERKEIVISKLGKAQFKDDCILKEKNEELQSQWKPIKKLFLIKTIKDATNISRDSVGCGMPKELIPMIVDYMIEPEPESGSNNIGKNR